MKTITVSNDVSGKLMQLHAMPDLLVLFAPEKHGAIRRCWSEESVEGAVVCTNLNERSMHYGQRTVIFYGRHRKIPTLKAAAQCQLGNDADTVQFPTAFLVKTGKRG